MRKGGGSATLNTHPWRSDFLNIFVARADFYEGNLALEDGLALGHNSRQNSFLRLVGCVLKYSSLLASVSLDDHAFDSLVHCLRLRRLGLNMLRGGENRRSVYRRIVLLLRDSWTR